jgi:hypothetical protein
LAFKVWIEETYARNTGYPGRILGSQPSGLVVIELNDDHKRVAFTWLTQRLTANA